MVCPVCPAAGVVGGAIGGLFGIYPPKHPGGRELSMAVTGCLTGLTIIGFGLSLCIDGKMTIKNAVVVAVRAAVIGVVYSIGVNYLLNRFVFPHPITKAIKPAQKEELIHVEIEPQSQPAASSSCCCHCNEKE